MIQRIPFKLNDYVIKRERIMIDFMIGHCRETLVLAVIEAQQRAIDKALSKPQPWQVHFREFRAYVDTVLDYLRRKGFNAKVCMRIASDRDWVLDVRQEKFWIEDLNKKHQYKHHLYRKEAIFYGTYQVSTGCGNKIYII